MAEDDDPIEGAPEGASCAEHEGAAALVTCPRCGSYCCVTCWQPTHRRCQACLLREPVEPVPWTEPDRSFVARLFWTVAAAIRPRATAAGFAHAPWRGALSFAALTLLPVAAVAGVIPFTHRLAFGNRWSVSPLRDPSGTELALDIAGAMGLGVLVGVAQLALVAGVFSLLATRRDDPRYQGGAALSAVLYRGWLLPMGGSSGLLLGLVIWGFPLNVDSTMQIFAGLASIAPLLLLTAALIATARQACGHGPLRALFVGLLPVVILLSLEPMLLTLLGPLLPEPAVIDAAMAP